MAGDDTVLDSPPRAAPGLVVGVGASAGGLAALEALFAALPPERPSGLSFVVVQHLAPDHKSILAELVQRRTAWPVVEVGAESVVEPDHIYIVPPNRDLTLVDRRLILATPTAPRGQHLPIDSFFVSLSALGPRAVAIILSGSGRDGSAGAVAVKEAGGTVIVHPASAAFDEMPRQALATGVADRVLAPGEMPIALAAMAARSDGDAVPEPAALGALERASVGQILAVLRSRTGHDFAEYKQNTILRRIERRMAQLRIATGGEYLGRLVDDPSEADHLFRDLLIGVTSFFRDPDAFEALRARAITQLFTDRPAGALVRVWVPGCSTGEEAYALAILLHELSIQLGGTVGVQLFATDVDRRAIDRARAGVYPASVAADLGAERLERWFVLEPDGASYRVGRAIRDLCVFSEHDVTRDPPFSKLDVVSCRNLFIYFDARLQKRLLALFHYALEPGGLLLLGTSETVGDAGELFATVDQQHGSSSATSSPRAGVPARRWRSRASRARARPRPSRPRPRSSARCARPPSAGCSTSSARPASWSTSAATSSTCTDARASTSSRRPARPA
ncbi:MAG: CheR family methyltransferase [Myxococcota bacterium]